MTMTGCVSTPLFVDDIRSSDPAGGSALVVLPVSGVDADTGRRLGENMAWGLREAGYPALYADQPNKRQPILRGAIDETDFGEEVVWLSLRWTVHAPAAETDGGQLGEIVGVHRHQVATTIEQWAVLSRQAVNLIVAEAVPAVHEISSSLIFPDGMPVSTAGELLPDRQLASLGEVSEGDTIIVSGDGMVVMPAETDLAKSGTAVTQTAQFEPVFEPAASEAPLEPASGPVFPSEPAPVKAATAFERTVPEAPPPKPDATRIKQAEIMPKPTGQLLNTRDDIDELPSVPRDPVASEVVSTSAGGAKDGVSPFTAIDDDLSAFSDAEVLTPTSAALVTTDPWLTINEPVRPSETTVPSEAATADDQSGNQVSEPESPDSSDEVQVIVSNAEPPPLPPAAPDMTNGAQEAGAFGQPVSETVVAETPAEEVPASPDVEEGARSTELASGEISAGALDARAAPNAGRPVFIVRNVTGAPGDGNAALTRAIRGALRQISAAVTDDPTQATHVLQGSVRVDSPFAGRQKVRIVWQVTEIDGTETGKAMQENQVPQGSLDGAWGGTADKVAEAAVVGVAGLFSDSISATKTQGLSQPDLPHVGND
ncbi:MAG: hypothetical protein RIC16_08130 [Rhodospirillales bacterium]